MAIAIRDALVTAPILIVTISSWCSSRVDIGVGVDDGRLVCKGRAVEVLGWCLAQRLVLVGILVVIGIVVGV